MFFFFFFMISLLTFHVNIVHEAFNAERQFDRICRHLLLQLLHFCEQTQEGSRVGLRFHVVLLFEFRAEVLGKLVVNVSTSQIRIGGGCENLKWNESVNNLSRTRPSPCQCTIDFSKFSTNQKSGF